MTVVVVVEVDISAVGLGVESEVLEELGDGFAVTVTRGRVVVTVVELLDIPRQEGLISSALLTTMRYFSTYNPRPGKRNSGYNIHHSGCPDSYYIHSRYRKM
mgnify:CR=1 FL=1